MGVGGGKIEVIIDTPDGAEWADGPDDCSICKGVGSMPTGYCRACDGQGTGETVSLDDTGQIVTHYNICERCRGTGIKCRS